MLRDQYNIKSYTYGGNGRNSKPFQPTSFEGGIVVHYKDLEVKTTAEIKRAPSLSKLVFPVQGTIPLWETYSTRKDRLSSTVPAEWVPEPAENYIAAVDSLDAKGIWEAVAVTMR